MKERVFCNFVGHSVEQNVCDHCTARPRETCGHIADPNKMVDRAPCDNCGGGPDVRAIGCDPAAAEAFLRGDG